MEIARKPNPFLIGQNKEDLHNSVSFKIIEELIKFSDITKSLDIKPIEIGLIGHITPFTLNELHHLGLNPRGYIERQPAKNVKSPYLVIIDNYENLGSNSKLIIEGLKKSAGKGEKIVVFRKDDLIFKGPSKAIKEKNRAERKRKNRAKKR